MRKLIYCLGLVTCMSCSDFLDREPVEQISFDAQLSNIEGHFQALEGAYTEFEDLSTSLFFIYADALAGNVKFAPNTQGVPDIDPRFELTYRFEESEDMSNFEFFYEDSYEVINAVNLILDRIDAVEGTEADKNLIKAQALAMRAYLHANLLKVYAQPYNFTSTADHLGIVYNTSPLKIGEDFPARLSASQSYALVEADYLEALDRFENASDQLNEPLVYYFNPLNVKALLSRHYIFTEQWENAISYANEVIAEGPELTPREVLLDQWLSFSPISETLLELVPPRDQEAGIIRFSVSTYFQVVTNSEGEVLENKRYAASEDLLSLYSENDIRGTHGLLKTYSIPTETPAGFEDMPFHFTQKFANPGGSMIIRQSEIYLNRAEAYAKTDRPGLAMEDLNRIKLRANPEEELQVLEGQNLVDEILRERRKELAFEGHLFFDLARNGKDVIRDDGCNVRGCRLNYPNPRFVLPIPEASILINQNMQQNEGY